MHAYVHDNMHAYVHGNNNPLYEKIKVIKVFKILNIQTLPCAYYKNTILGLLYLAHNVLAS